TFYTLPFGGIGESGTRAYYGKFSFDAFSHKKVVMYRSFMGDAPSRYPPYTPGKLRLLKALLDGNTLSSFGNASLSLHGDEDDGGGGGGGIPVVEPRKHGKVVKKDDQMDVVTAECRRHLL
nr:aldehyde dehydrogenase family 3 member H1 [Tanacetum cinerariifolium]